SIDGRVLSFAVLVSATTGLLFGLAPALRATKIDVSGALKIGGKVVAGRSSSNTGALLIGAEVALSLLLVTAAGLFGRSLYNLTHVPLGFDPDRVVNVDVNTRNSGIAVSALPSVYASVLRSVESVPGVTSAAFAECGLAGGCRSASDGIAISGYTAAPS